MPSFINIDSCFISFFLDLVWLFNYVILKSSPDFNIDRLVDSTDFRSLNTQPSHQTPLVESERVDTAVKRIAGKAPRHSFINKHDTWTGPNLPSMGIVYPIDCFLAHGEERVTILMHPRLSSRLTGYR